MVLPEELASDTSEMLPSFSMRILTVVVNFSLALTMEVGCTQRP